MDSDEGYNYEFDDEEEECSEDSVEEETADDTLELGEVELVDPVVAGGERDDCGETGGLGPGQDEEDYRFEVLTAEQILQHMVECIREVNEVIQVRVFRGSPELRPTLITKEEILTSFRETLPPVDNSRDMKKSISCPLKQTDLLLRQQNKYMVMITDMKEKVCVNPALSLSLTHPVMT